MSESKFIIFVGDKPSSKNKDKDIAFVGTKSYKTLLEWIYLLDLDLNSVYICNKSDIKSSVCKSSGPYLSVNTPSISLDVFRQDVIIALGDNAFKHLKKEVKKTGGEFNLIKMPHPSGLNRTLNDKAFVKSEIARIKKIIHNKKEA